MRLLSPKRNLAPVAILSLALALYACGSSRQTSSARHSAVGDTAAAAPVITTPDRDKDNDFSPADDTNNDETLNFGHAASPADARAVAMLIHRYYAAALAGDGAEACALLYITYSEAVAGDYGKGSAGPAYLSEGTTCPAVMTLLFRHYHAQLAVELPLLKVRRVRLQKHHGLAVLSFGSLPERQIPIQREKGIWRVEALLDGELP